MKNEIKLLTKNGTVYATSRQLAEDFEKRHDHVLESIRDLLTNLIPENSGVKNLSTTYFIESTYIKRGKQYPEYLFTKDGFTLLAMGFTGVKALQFKIDYINKFNEMEAQLKEVAETMSTKGEMTLEDWNDIRFSIKRTISTFADSNADDVKQLVTEFITYAINLDTKTRVVRCESAMKGLQILHDNLAKESSLNIAECYKILQYKDRIKDVQHMAENRRNGQLKAHQGRKIKSLVNKLEQIS